MATIKENGQSYLETQGIDARKEQTAYSDYNDNYEYGNPKEGNHGITMEEGGKGTGDFGGHGHSVPDMTKPKDQMDYKGFNTFDGGSDCDRQARNVMLNRSIYGPGTEYGVNIIPDTSLNISDGQYDGGAPVRGAYVCPVV